MLTMIFNKNRGISYKDIQNKTGKPVCPFPDYIFDPIANGGHNFAKEQFYLYCAELIDNSKLLAPGVLQHKSGRCYPYIQSSTGVKYLWLLSTDMLKDYIQSSEWLGENCLPLLLKISQEKDLILWDNSGCFIYIIKIFYKCMCRNCNLVYEIKDYETGDILNLKEKYDSVCLKYAEKSEDYRESEFWWECDEFLEERGYI